jgi:rRNA maturation endonuclease Nob1
MLYLHMEEKKGDIKMATIYKLKCVYCGKTISSTWNQAGFTIPSSVCSSCSRKIRGR